MSPSWCCALENPDTLIKLTTAIAPTTAAAAATAAAVVVVVVAAAAPAVTAAANSSADSFIALIPGNRLGCNPRS